MKLMTYNIYKGAIKTLPQVVEIIKSVNPDFLTLNEANTFADDDCKILKQFAQDTGFPYFEIACRQTVIGKNTALLSKQAFKKISIIEPLNRAYIKAVIKTPIGEIAITSVHLSYISEDERLQEIEVIINSQSQYKNRIIMGDMNALARLDKYQPETASVFNEKQLSKFARPDKSLRHEVIDKVLSADYFDPAVQLEKNNESTVPTLANEDLAHADVPLRLDYIFLSKSFLPRLKNYSVIKNKLTDGASDHYPVTVEIE